MALTKVTYSMIDSTYANAKDFGAVGDGVTDDTSAIQAAIDAVSAKGGGTVFLPDGNYLVSNSGSGISVSLKTQVTLQGETNTRLTSSGSAIVLDGRDGINFITIKDVDIYGSGGAADLAEIGVSFRSNCYNTRIENVRVFNVHWKQLLFFRTYSSKH